MDLKKSNLKRKTFEVFEEEEKVTVKNVKVIELLEKKALPDFKGLDDKEKYYKDLESRPQESEEQYNRVPIDQFGAALLRGMGWREGRAVGKNPDGLVKPIELKARPSLLGLGATPNPLEAPPKAKKVLPGDKIVEKKSPDVVVQLPEPRNKVKDEKFNKGDAVKIIDGRHAGGRGKVIETSMKKDGIAVKIQLENNVVKVWDDQVEIIREYWLRPHINVRIVSKKFKNGDYYYEKCFVHDVISRGLCTLKTSKGVMLDQVDQKYLETIIPQPGEQVMILKRVNDVSPGEIAKVVECDKKRETAVLRIESTFEIETFSFDDFSEYAAEL